MPEKVTQGGYGTNRHGPGIEDIYDMEEEQGKLVKGIAYDSKDRQEQIEST